jgi:hypothetical protein
MSEDVPRYGAVKPEGESRTDEFRMLMQTLGWSQRKTASELEVDDRTLRYWAAGNPPAPLHAIFALRYLVGLEFEKGAAHLKANAAAGSMNAGLLGSGQTQNVVHKEFEPLESGVDGSDERAPIR